MSNEQTNNLNIVGIKSENSVGQNLAIIKSYRSTIFIADLYSQLIKDGLLYDDSDGADKLAPATQVLLNGEPYTLASPIYKDPLTLSELEVYAQLCHPINYTLSIEDENGDVKILTEGVDIHHITEISTIVQHLLTHHRLWHEKTEDGLCEYVKLKLQAKDLALKNTDQN